MSTARPELILRGRDSTESQSPRPAEASIPRGKAGTSKALRRLDCFGPLPGEGQVLALGPGTSASQELTQKATPFVRPPKRCPATLEGCIEVKQCIAEAPSTLTRRAFRLFTLSRDSCVDLELGAWYASVLIQIVSV